MPAAIRLKTRYTGYLRRHASGVTTPAPALPFGDDPYLLVTAGGGGDGEPMMDWVLRAYEEDRQLPYPALMVLGPFMPQEQQRELIDRAERSEERRVGKSVSVRVDLGGRRIIKKKKNKHTKTTTILYSVKNPTKTRKIKHEQISQTN